MSAPIDFSFYDKQRRVIFSSDDYEAWGNSATRAEADSALRFLISRFKEAHGHSLPDSAVVYDGFGDCHSYNADQIAKLEEHFGVKIKQQLALLAMDRPFHLELTQDVRCSTTLSWQGRRCALPVHPSSRGLPSASSIIRP
jgi:hypothetical protein